MSQLGLIGLVVLCGACLSGPRAPDTIALPQPSGTIRGVVVDTVNGTGVGRVSVRLQTSGRIAVTDDAGRFELADVPAGAQELYVSAVDFILVKRTVVVSTGAPSDITIVLSEGTAALTEPGAEQRVAGGVFVNASITTHYANALNGYARGIEWLVQRQSPNGFSEWASYAFGYSRYHDVTTGETFWGDSDQRHTVNMYGTYRATDRLSLSARFRYGSNFPAAGYWDRREGQSYLGTERNIVRVAPYVRADIRANRTFAWSQKRLTLFLEAINVTNRTNVRFALPSVNRRTFEATGLYETMIPLIPSIGILLEF